MTLYDPAELAQVLFEELGDALFLIDPQSDRLLEVNPVALRLTGFSRDELLAYPAMYLFRFEATGGHQRLRGAFKKTIVFHSQDGFLLRTKAENWIPVNLTVSRLHVGETALGLIIARDDRERRQALAQARRVEAELRAVLANSPAALWSAARASGADVTTGWQFRYVSPIVAKIANRPIEFFEHPFSWADIVHPADRDGYRTRLRRLLQGDGTQTEVTYRILMPDGDVRWIRDRLRIVRDEAQRPTRLDCCLLDITEQHLAELALRQSEQRFRALVEKNRDAVLLIDERGIIRYATPAALSTVGHDPANLLGKNALSLLHPDDVEPARSRWGIGLARPGEDITQTVRVIAADGSTRLLDATICNRLADPSVQAVVVNCRDTTEQNRLEEQLRQSQKLEAVGRLAGGIAHDFNNLLTVILGNLELIRSGLANGEEAELLAATERAATQAAELTKQMLGFARRQPLRTITLDLNTLVQESIRLLRRTIDPRIEVCFLPAADLPPVATDPVQVQQVLMNLCLNARDAMPDGGTLTVETANAGLLRPPGTGIETPPTGFVRLSVIDTGIGMSDEVRTKIFEPFFTTKQVGQGTGLGLAVVYGVARAHGGWVDCTSTPGKGSQFDFFLPWSTSSSETVAASNECPVATIRGQGETILVADDEPLVRSLAKQSLERHGYQVLVAADGAQAVEFYRREAERIALVVLDLSMPNLSGRQVYTLIRELNPQAKVIVASGHSRPEMICDDPNVRYLHKPYTPSTLAIAVRNALATTPLPA
jgi:PAS domain S-box-containing protein